MSVSQTSWHKEIVLGWNRIIRVYSGCSERLFGVRFKFFFNARVKEPSCWTQRISVCLCAAIVAPALRGGRSSSCVRVYEHSWVVGCFHMRRAALKHAHRAETHKCVRVLSGLGSSQSPVTRERALCKTSLQENVSAPISQGFKKADAGWFQC